MLALTAIAGLTATVWVRTRERSFDTSAGYHLALRDRDAQGIDTAGAAGLATHSVELGFDRRLALYQHPPSSYRFADVPVSEGAVLRVAPVLAPEASQTSTAGAVFEILCEDPAGHGRKAFRMEAVKPDPGGPPRWDDRDVPLAGCSQPTTSVELRTACGPNGHCDGIVFATARSPSPWTIPSHASLFTSTSPLVRGVAGQTTWSPDLSTLAERFRDHGWSTAAFVDTPWLVMSGFQRGFEHFHGTQPATLNLDRRRAAITLEHLREWLASDAAQRAFVFWHIMDGTFTALTGPALPSPDAIGGTSPSRPDQCSACLRFARSAFMNTSNSIAFDSSRIWWPPTKRVWPVWMPRSASCSVSCSRRVGMTRR